MRQCVHACVWLILLDFVVSTREVWHKFRRRHCFLIGSKTLSLSNDALNGIIKLFMFYIPKKSVRWWTVADEFHCSRFCVALVHWIFDFRQAKYGYRRLSSYAIRINEMVFRYRWSSRVLRPNATADFGYRRFPSPGKKKSFSSLLPAERKMILFSHERRQLVRFAVNDGGAEQRKLWPLRANKAIGISLGAGAGTMSLHAADAALIDNKLPIQSVRCATSQTRPCTTNVYARTYNHHTNHSIYNWGKSPQLDLSNGSDAADLRQFVCPMCTAERCR